MLPQRFLIVVRLSADRDNSTSPERQVDHCRSAISIRGGSEAGVAEDLAVSATKYNPFQRPELGKWLTDPDLLATWDVLVVWRLDRLVRNTKDLADLLAWCDKNGKGLVSATEGFDLSTPFGRAMVTIIAALAQLEAETVKLRVTDAHAKLRTMNRWASGVPPLGYRAVPHPSGKGVGLELDPDAQKLLHEMADRLLDGWSLTKITEWLNETGALTSTDRVRVDKGKEALRKPWTVSNVRRILTSPATQGFKTRFVKGGSSPGELVLDENGEPIVMADPVFKDPAKWEQVQSAILERSLSGKRRTWSSNPMFGIGKCGRCGASLAQQFSGGGKYRSYRCGRTPINCNGVTIRADDADEILRDTFLERYGNRTITRRVFIPGTDNRADIEQTRGAIKRLRAESDAGLITDEHDYLHRLGVLTKRLRELEKDPYRPSRWETVETEQTFAEAWEHATHQQIRLDMMQNAGVVFRLDSKKPLKYAVFIKTADDPEWTEVITPVPPHIEEYGDPE